MGNCAENRRPTLHSPERKQWVSQCGPRGRRTAGINPVARLSRIHFHHPWVTLLGLAALLLTLTGCANYAKNAPLYQRQVTLENQNAALRAKVQRQTLELNALRRQLAARTPRFATLPPERLRQLFTVRRIIITSDTRATQWRRKAVGAALRHSAGRPAHPQCGFRVFVRTEMAGGQTLPATGTFTITAFDLAVAHGSARIGRWVFTPLEAQKDWYGWFGLDAFAFDCPWVKPPRHDAITFRVQFVDALTGRLFTTQRLLRLQLHHLLP